MADTARTANAIPDARPREIRFALTMNGGVGLAVWMGGITTEILELARGEDSIYQRLLEEVDATASVDVIAGVSAGGLNGAVLAYALANGIKTIEPLKTLWVNQGSFQKLLRSPYDEDADSLLKGDEFFLPMLAQALRDLDASPGKGEPVSHDLDLLIATSVLDGVPIGYVDSAGRLIH